MDQQDAALGTALGPGERGLDRSTIGELGLDLL